MNLHAMVKGAIGAVNPHVTISLKRSTGYTTASTGARTPTYDTLTGEAQIQPVSTKEFAQLSALNIQGFLKSVYLYGNWFGVLRVQEKGGDLLLFDNATWLVVQQAEAWPDWSRVIVSQQRDPAGL